MAGYGCGRVLKGPLNQGTINGTTLGVINVALVPLKLPWCQMAGGSFYVSGFWDRFWVILAVKQCQTGINGSFWAKRVILELTGQNRFIYRVYMHSLLTGHMRAPPSLLGTPLGHTPPTCPHVPHDHL